MSNDIEEVQDKTLNTDVGGIESGISDSIMSASTGISESIVGLESTGVFQGSCRLF